MTTACAGTPFSCRRCTIADVAVLVDFRLGFLSTTKCFDDRSRESMRIELARMYESRLRSSAMCLWFCEIAGIPVASCGLLFRNGSRQGVRSIRARKAELMNVYTLPDFRRRGAASFLVPHVLAAARDMGIELLVLQPTELSRSLYARLGFTGDANGMSLELHRAPIAMP